MNKLDHEEPRVFCQLFCRLKFNLKLPLSSCSLWGAFIVKETLNVMCATGVRSDALQKREVYTT